MITHFYFHSKEIPARYQECIDSWKPFHEIKIWYPDDIGIDKSIGCCRQSDIARFKILYELGGLWADTDCLCIKSLDELVADNESFAFATGYQVAVANCLIYSKSGNPLIKELLVDTVKMAEEKTDILTQCKRHSDLLSKCSVVYPKEYMPYCVAGGYNCMLDKAYVIHKHFLGWEQK